MQVLFIKTVLALALVSCSKFQMDKWTAGLRFELPNYAVSLVDLNFLKVIIVCVRLLKERIKKMFYHV